MATKNDITNDSLITKASSDAYRNNYDLIFKKKESVGNTVGEEQVETMKELVELFEEMKLYE